MEKTHLQILTEKAADGDRAAERELIEFFLPRALFIAKRKIGGLNQSVSDADDLANSAIRSLCMRIRDGRIVFHHDNQLMGVMRKIISNKASKLWRYHTADKRDVNRKAEVHREGFSPELFLQAGMNPADLYLDDCAIRLDASDATTIFKVLQSLERELHGLFTGLLNTLEPFPRKVLILLLERDYSNEELAAKIGRSLNSVARYRNAIRESLKQLMA